ncbi:MAG: glucuronate isomerase [Clostridium sp.]|uniref:glucuronate isomerase n=1 Tax=Clostridium sp. TaxID=1506 RepID=UPI00290A4A46|nr:glucuronate isomerase [Clostridium sp.]MDU5109906.1 glucuronate isomerase [Clostridium sp.]
MKHFIHDDFLLNTATSRELYHNNAKHMPIIDFHNHLNTKEIYEDICYENISDLWLGSDHYKWRAMRTYGIPEELITGDADPFNKFLAWSETVQNSIGNPLYHWTHLELKRYFGINKTLSPATASEIWNECNAKLKTKEYSVRNLLRMQNVEVLCTTDDPIDDLIWHKKLKEDCFEIEVLPTFRPEIALGIDKDDFQNYISQLGEKYGKVLLTIQDLLSALKECLNYFVDNGCRVTDHSLEGDFYVPASCDEVNNIYKKRMSGGTITNTEAAMYRGFLLTELGKEYSKHNLVMQLHIGAIRNNSTRMFEKIGPNAGFDSLNDYNYAPELSGLLNAIDKTDELPKTILYYLNPKDAEMLATMAGNFQSNYSGIKGKIQLGSAWWFCDHKNGMEHQMDVLSDVGLISIFIGMLTDSRSFLSFPRHEYFRRILCNKIGKIVENEEYPKDMKYLGNMIKNICYNNAKIYFNLFDDL